MKTTAESMGSCRIYGGKHTRNHFIYFPNSKSISLDFDSDFGLDYQVNLNNPKKAYEKAKRVVEQFLNKDVTVEELVKSGFEHDIPEEYYDIKNY